MYIEAIEDFQDHLSHTILLDEENKSGTATQAQMKQDKVGD
jgi:hypothetical protein